MLVNGLILGALVLIEEPAPPVGEQPVIVLDLERQERPRAVRRSAPAPARSEARSAASSDASTRATAGEGAPAAGAPGEASAATPAVDPRWRVDPKAVDRWRITEGVPEWGWGRYYRACKGFSSEHMTDEEKDRCYAGWGGSKDKRPSPAFVGPIDERKWEESPPGPRKPPTADDDKRRRRDLCRVVGRLRKADPSAAPLVRQGACP